MSNSEPSEPPTYQNCEEVSDFCRVEFTVFGDYLSTGASVFFGAAFAILFILQLFWGIRGRMWSYTVWLGIGTAFEVIGYIARGVLSRNPWVMNAFIAQYLTLLLAPTLVAAAISVTFKQIVIWYGPQWSVLRPRLYPWIFVGTDFLSIFIQVIGGAAIATTTSGNGSETTQELGEALVIAGVVFQVANMVCCASLMLIYARRRRAAVKSGLVQITDQSYPPADYPGKIPRSRLEASPQAARRVRFFIYALGLAYTAIIIRCIYRIFEVLPATASDVMRNETLFYLLDSVMILIAISAVTLLHPFNFFPYLGLKIKKQEQYPMN